MGGAHVSAAPKDVLKHPCVDYMVLGEGDDLDRIKSLAAEAEVADRVQFRGTVKFETLVDAYRCQNGGPNGHWWRYRAAPSAAAARKTTSQIIRRRRRAARSA